VRIQCEQTSLTVSHDLIDRYQATGIRIQEPAAADNALAHRRPSRQYDQIRLLEAAQQLVQFGEAGGHAQEVALVAVQIVDPIDDAVHDLADGGQLSADSALRYVEDQLLGPVDGLVDVVRLFVRERGDLPRDADQPAQGGGAFDDVGIVLDVNGRRDAVDQAGDVGRAPDLLQLVAAFQLVDQGHEIGGLAALLQVEHSLVDPAVFLAVEVIDAGVAKPTVYLESGCRWTEIIGSDSHTFQGPNAPGSRFTWVKMAKPSLEGLRLALLDGAGFSVRRSDEADGFDPFHLPEHYIQAIEISKARYMGQGQPATLKFSPWFNALVGGRGTGKSTVVHGLRLGYRRADELQRLGEENECRRVFDAFARVSKNRTDQGGLRADTEIVVTLSRDGVPHRLRWRQDAAGDVVEEPSGGSWTTSASQAVTPERFPIRIFSQGQIAAQMARIMGRGQRNR